ncbi:hypothetical protein [Rhizobium sp. RU36D]|uniref:hypothetical protein n=1 Tax=Rhizobium sp. RU36D TaxID=1907415 RepID=UPI0009D8DF46|nr:hypothetical protein [Rhizobium sp. RU36D]SMC84777.1 hypothetical protein SAMN05880593_10837 [Rhizobium sp. RU36D]
MKIRLFTVTLASLLLTGTASTLAIAQTAADPIESYCATLSEDDHHASDGYELRDAAAIIRQDRANYHQFGVRDPGDENDSTFSSKANRARLEQMLKRGSMDRSVRNAIVNGTPDVCIDVYRNYINVTLM